MTRYLFLLLALVCFVGCNKTTVPETLVTDGLDDVQLEAAYAKAKASVEEFITALNSGEGTEFAVKEPITDINGSELFWIKDLKYSNGEFTGVIGNDPGVVKNVKYGDKRVIPKTGISDWVFFKDDKMYGNYTMRVMMESMPEDEKPDVVFGN